MGYDAEDLACFTAHRFARISPAPANREISARAVTRSADPRRCGKLANHRDRSVTLPITTKEEVSMCRTARQIFACGVAAVVFLIARPAGAMETCNPV